MRTARSQFSTLHQVCSLIPPHLVSKLARVHGVDKRSRTFSPWSHVVTLVYAQLVHALSLNDVCDGLRLFRGDLRRVRGATPPSRNALSHANKERPASMAEALFWAVFSHLTSRSPGFGGRTYHGFPRRFKRAIHVVDSTTIQLVAQCVDWARHKRSKAGAKVHVRLDLQSWLPRFVIVDTARPSDNKSARAMCAGVRRSEIVIFDKAYVDFAHLRDLDARGVFWVTRAKDNLYAQRLKTLHEAAGAVLEDSLVRLGWKKSRRQYRHPFRLVRAVVELKGVPTEMGFITNNLDFAPSTIADLYKRRWAIEAFFKQLKQTLQLCDFLGHSKNAIQWQVWMALLTYLLLRYLAFLSQWPHSFSRLLTLVRAAIWRKIDLHKLLRRCGTADGDFRLMAAPHQAYLPGFTPT